MSVRLVTASRCWSMPTGGGGVEDGEGGSTSRGSGPEPPTKEKGWRVPLRLRGAAGGVLHTPSQLHTRTNRNTMPRNEHTHARRKRCAPRDWHAWGGGEE
eukprot:1157779-Pelagomonas_calceolata.AAC.24